MQSLLQISQITKVGVDILNIQETLRKLANMYSLKYLLLNGYSYQIDNSKSFFQE